MQNSEKIGIILVVILFIWFIYWAFTKDNKKTTSNTSNSFEQRQTTPINMVKCSNMLSCYEYYTKQLMDSVNEDTTMGIQNYKISVLKDRYTYLQKCLNK